MCERMYRRSLRSYCQGMVLLFGIKIKTLCIHIYLFSLSFQNIYKKKILNGNVWTQSICIYDENDDRREYETLNGCYFALFFLFRVSKMTLKCCKDFPNLLPVFWFLEKKIINSSVLCCVNRCIFDTFI